MANKARSKKSDPKKSSDDEREIGSFDDLHEIMKDNKKPEPPPVTMPTVEELNRRAEAKQAAEEVRFQNAVNVAVAKVVGEKTEAEKLQAAAKLAADEASKKAAPAEPAKVAEVVKPAVAEPVKVEESAKIAVLVPVAVETPKAELGKTVILEKGLPVEPPMTPEQIEKLKADKKVADDKVKALEAEDLKVVDALGGRKEGDKRTTLEIATGKSEECVKWKDALEKEQAKSVLTVLWDRRGKQWLWLAAIVLLAVLVGYLISRGNTTDKAPAIESGPSATELRLIEKLKKNKELRDALKD